MNGKEVALQPGTDAVVFDVFEPQSMPLADKHEVFRNPERYEAGLIRHQYTQVAQIVGPNVPDNVYLYEWERT
jgi:hypothetical protein